MKKYFYTPILVMLFTALAAVNAQNQQDDYLGLPGDNLNLYAVMKLFQESETLEGFERALNDPDSKINNLDLNGDGYVDYIRVIDNEDRNVHYIVLQVSINRKENQDVAVFTVIKNSDGSVGIQLIGDEALYGKNYIIEPIYDETPNPGYMGNARSGNPQRVVVTHTTTVQVAAWPLIHFIFLPTYVVWHSPWYYDYYPDYWRPWSPFYWHYYYGYQSHYYSYYYGHYRHWNEYRYPEYHSYYYNGHRSYSPYVGERIHEGYYKTTYSHPEQRREGSALYVKSHPEQSNRSAGGTSVNNSGRRTGTTNSTGRTSGTTETSSGRRSTATGTGRPTTTTGTSRQSTTTGTSRQSTTTGTSRQSTATGTSRQSTTTGTSRQSTTTNSDRRTTTTGTNRQPTSSGTTRPSTSAGTTRQSSTGVSSNAGGRRSTTAPQSTYRTNTRSNSSGTSTGTKKKQSEKRPCHIRRTVEGNKRQQNQRRSRQKVIPDGVKNILTGKRDAAYCVSFCLYICFHPIAIS